MSSRIFIGARASRQHRPLPSASKRFPAMAKLLNLPRESLSFSQKYILDCIPLLHFAVDTLLSYDDPAAVDYNEAVRNPAIVKALLCLVDFTVLNGDICCLRNYLAQKDAKKLLEHLKTAVENILNHKFDQDGFVEDHANAKILVVRWLAATLMLETRLSRSVSENVDVSLRYQKNRDMLNHGCTEWIKSEYSTVSFFKICDGYLKEIDPETTFQTATIYYSIHAQIQALKVMLCSDYRPGVPLAAVRTFTESLNGLIQEAIDFCRRSPSSACPAFKLIRNFFAFESQLKLLLSACLRAPDFNPLLKETDQLYATWWSVSKKYKTILKLALKQVKDERIPDPYSVVLINRLLITAMACGIFQTVSVKEVEAACAEMKSALAAVSSWAPAYFRMEMDNDLQIILEGLLPLLRKHDRGDGAGVSPFKTPGFLEVYTPEKVHERLYRDESLKTCAACGIDTIDLYACSRVSCCLFFFFENARHFYFLTLICSLFLSQCKHVWYCDSVCQKSHFPAHKKACKEAQAKNDATYSSTPEKLANVKIISFPAELLKLRDIPPQQRLPCQNIMVSSMKKLEFAVTTIRGQGTRDALDFKLPQITKATLAFVEVLISNGNTASFEYYLPQHIVHELEIPLKRAFLSIYTYNFEEEDGGNPSPEILVSAFLGLVLASAYQIASNFESGSMTDEGFATINSMYYSKIKSLLVYNTPENISKCNEYLQTLGSDLTAELLISCLINDKLSLQSLMCFEDTFFEHDFNPEGLANQLEENVQRALEMTVDDPFYKKTTSLFAFDAQFKAMAKGMVRHSVEPTDGWWSLTSLYFQLLKKALMEARAAVPADAYSAAVTARAVLHALVCGVFQRVTYRQVDLVCKEMKKNAAACAEWSPPEWQRQVKIDVEIVQEDVLPFLQSHDGAADMFTSGFKDLYTPDAVSSRLSKGLEGTEMCACCGKRGTDLVKCFGCESVWYCMNHEKPGKPSKCQIKHQNIHTKDVCGQMKKRRTASRMMTEGFDVEIIPEEGEEGGIMGFRAFIAEKDDD